MPYLQFRAASLGVEQPLFCHCASGEEPYFLVSAESPDGISPVPAFSVDEDMLETYFLSFLERRFEPERNARKAWEPKGFDVCGCNEYGTIAVRVVLSDMCVPFLLCGRGKIRPFGAASLRRNEGGDLFTGRA